MCKAFLVSVTPSGETDILVRRAAFVQPANTGGLVVTDFYGQKYHVTADQNDIVVCKVNDAGSLLTEPYALPTLITYLNMVRSAIYVAPAQMAGNDVLKKLIASKKRSST
jgi:hypothetical protein